MRQLIHDLWYILECCPNLILLFFNRVWHYIELLSGHLRNLFSQNELIKVVIRIERWYGIHQHLCICVIIYLLFLLLDVVCAISVRSLPVLLVKIGMIDFVMRYRTRCWIPVLDLRRRLVVLVALQTDAKFERLPPIQARLIHLAKHLVHYL